MTRPIGAYLTLLAVLALLVPLFLRSPLTVDAVFYDICARHLLRGGAPERDFHLLMPSGTYLVVAAVRALLGYSSEVLRLADLLFFAAIVGLLASWLRHSGLGVRARAWAVVVLVVFYLTAIDYVHCQPDLWMLLPALAALHLRLRASSTAPPSAGGAAFRWSILEGALWGSACLIKPFAVVPGALVWLVATARSLHGKERSPRRVVVDAVGLLLGGLLIGAAWQAWLLRLGAFDTFWHNNAAYRGVYYTQSESHVDRLGGLLVKLAPWGFLHLVALPTTAVALYRSMIRRSTSGVHEVADGLLAACYLGWLLQATFLQFQFQYHLVPPTLLGLTLLARVQMWLPRLLTPVVVVIALLAAVLVEPQLDRGGGLRLIRPRDAVRPARLALWGRCWSESSPELKDLLHLHYGTSWTDLDRVADYLRSRDAADGDVLAHHLTTTPIHTELGLRPGTRFLYPSTYLLLFPTRRGEILAELKGGNHRFLVTDVEDFGLSPEAARAEKPGDPLAFPPTFPEEAAQRWPFAEPVVFRSGRYFVHERRP